MPPAHKKQPVSVVRDAGHPWDGRAGFDHLYLNAKTQEELDGLVEKAADKFWSPWLVGTNELDGQPGAVMYKPCDIQEPWDDSVEEPHPGIERPRG